MITQTQGKIYLSAERGHTETGWFRSYSTFNFGDYHNESKKPFGPLYLLNDDTIAGGRNLLFHLEKNTGVIILPVVGAIEFCAPEGLPVLVEAGQCLSVYMDKGSRYSIQNPYEKALVNYVQLWIYHDDGAKAAEIQPSSFNIEDNKNRLVEIAFVSNGHKEAPTTLHIGKFDGRNEAILPLPEGDSAFFFVIQGAFEVAGRLLEARDGLALWNVKEADMEALSNEAIIIALSLKYSTDNT